MADDREKRAKAGDQIALGAAHLKLNRTLVFDDAMAIRRSGNCPPAAQK